MCYRCFDRGSLSGLIYLASGQSICVSIRRGNLVTHGIPTHNFFRICSKSMRSTIRGRYSNAVFFQSPLSVQFDNNDNDSNVGLKPPGSCTVCSTEIRLISVLPTWSSAIAPIWAPPRANQASAVRAEQEKENKWSRSVHQSRYPLDALHLCQSGVRLQSMPGQVCKSLMIDPSGSCRVYTVFLFLSSNSFREEFLIVERIAR